MAALEQRWVNSNAFIHPVHPAHPELHNACHTRSTGQNRSTLPIDGRDSANYIEPFFASQVWLAVSIAVSTCCAINYAFGVLTDTLKHDFEFSQRQVPKNSTLLQPVAAKQKDEKPSTAHFETLHRTFLNFLLLRLT
jgi:hypothetical protein